ncbi:hypothetical protein HUJ05_012879 [Dendroctonus ponderosae]|nr:hypothetical protein HUJ05_012879 [Dendroctonus ponderosae]
MSIELNNQEELVGKYLRSLKNGRASKAEDVNDIVALNMEQNKPLAMWTTLGQLRGCIDSPKVSTITRRDEDKYKESTVPTLYRLDSNRDQFPFETFSEISFEFYMDYSQWSSAGVIRHKGREIKISNRITPHEFYAPFAEQNNQSLSILNFVPVIDDDGKYLTCRAENPTIPDSALEDKWRLNVHCMGNELLLMELDVPVVTLKMGSTLNPEDIKEGDDVYFECNIRANPKAYKLSWFHNNVEIYQNMTAGVILSDQSLVLQNVVRATGGEYTCIATNTEGKGSSNPVNLSVKWRR